MFLVDNSRKMSVGVSRSQISIGIALPSGGIALPHLFRGTASRSDAGFTLIEQLVVIAIIATTLAAIGNLIGASSRGASQIERRVSLLQATNNLFLSAASSRDGLNYPKLDGADWDHRWHLTLTPVEEFGLILPENDRWMPMRVELLVKSPSGASMRLESIHLQKMPGR